MKILSNSHNGFFDRVENQKLNAFDAINVREKHSEMEQCDCEHVWVEYICMIQIAHKFMIEGIHNLKMKKAPIIRVDKKACKY